MILAAAEDDENIASRQVDKAQGQGFRADLESAKGVDPPAAQRNENPLTRESGLL